MNSFHPSITCCYLYIITKYGYPPPAENTLRYILEMNELGFKSIELEGIRKEHLLQVFEQRFKIKQTLIETDLQVPYFCAVLPGLSSSDKEERKQNLELFKTGCEIANLIGSKGILDNAPLPPYQFPSDIPVVRHYSEEVLTSARLPKSLKWDQYWKDMVQSYQQACDIAGEYGLSYQMHPCLGVMSASTDAFLYFAQAVNRSNLRFNMDTANQFFAKDNLMLSLIRLAGYIDYIHISDNRGHKVEHLPLEEGNIKWASFFDTLESINFNGHLGVDVGGAETGIEDIDNAYRMSAAWLQERMKNKIPGK